MDKVGMNGRKLFCFQSGGGGSLEGWVKEEGISIRLSR